MNIIYGSDHAEANDEQYQKDKQLYLSLSDTLNSSIRGDSGRMAVLSSISQALFQKRNTVSINKSSAFYRREQASSLPLRASRFFPELQRFLNNVGVTCRLDEFDNAIIAKIDVYTQALFSMEDPEYFRFKDFFFRLENCPTPLDLLFRGLFYTRARQNVGKTKWLIAGVILLVIAAFVLLCFCSILI